MAFRRFAPRTLNSPWESEISPGCFKVDTIRDVNGKAVILFTFGKSKRLAGARDDSLARGQFLLFHLAFLEQYLFRGSACRAPVANTAPDA